MESKELIEVIRGMLKEELEPIREGTSKVKDRLTVLKTKEQAIHKKLNNLTLDVKIAKGGIRRDIVQANDATETLIVVLGAKGISPKIL